MTQITLNPVRSDMADLTGPLLRTGIVLVAGAEATPANVARDTGVLTHPKQVELLC